MRANILILAGGLFVAAGAAFADPMQLTDAQMDGVSAGSTAAIAVGASNTLGDLLSETVSYSVALTDAGNAAFASNETAGLAVSTFFDAVSESASSSAAAIN